jgi:GntR family transcriptional regulator
MIRIDPSSPLPLYEQIKAGIKELVEKGLLKPGDAIPPARTLAETLVVTPAAVYRAYRELLKEGFLENRQDGKNPCISQNIPAVASDQMLDAVQKLLESAHGCLDAGWEWNQILAFLEFIKAGGSSKRDDPSLPLLLGHWNKLLLADKASHGVCPFCREQIKADEKKARCFVCGTSHHPECWNETGHCSVYGCKGKTQITF